MKILWVVNFMFPDIAEKLGLPKNISGGWLLDLSRQIADTDDISLAVACMYGGKTLVDTEINGIRYFLIPGGGRHAYVYSKSLVKYWERIDAAFDPDLVHLHGTEFMHGEVYLDHFKNRRFMLTVQGMLGPISREATAYVPLRAQFFSHTLKELYKFNGMREVKLLFAKNARHEEQIISKVDYVTGRTFWDEQLVKRINPHAKYFRCFFNLREEFYSADKWSIENIKRHTVYAGTAAQLSYKGGHIVVKAFREVLKQYPDARLILILRLDSAGRPVPQNGYQKYMLKLIDKLCIRDNIDFIPPQNAQEVINIMQSSHCMVVGSSMENASSTLREGMHIGVPCVASYRGGMTYLINDGEDGFFYDFPEYEYLAGRICMIFGDDELASRLSKNAVVKAEKWHDRQENTNAYLRIYREICKKER